jgi:hypothetical protein
MALDDRMKHGAEFVHRIAQTPVTACEETYTAGERSGLRANRIPQNRAAPRRILQSQRFFEPCQGFPIDGAVRIEGLRHIDTNSPEDEAAHRFTAQNQVMEALGLSTLQDHFLMKERL